MAGMTQITALQLDAQLIRERRESLGLGRTELANLLGLGATGERTIRGWETGEHNPTKQKIELVNNVFDSLAEVKSSAPFRWKATRSSLKFTFVDLFAGIGGFRLPFQQIGGKCVFTSEWDKFAQKTYLANFGEMPCGDITKIQARDIPDHDVLLGGFPCQAFSQAGLKQGFEDTRGTMFFEIQRILTAKRPKVIVLENVKQLKGHNKGQTLTTILSILRGEHDQTIPKNYPISDKARSALSTKLNYCTDYKILRAADFGVPQNRERLFIVAFDREFFGDKISFEDLFKWPLPKDADTRVDDILEDLGGLSEHDDKFTISDKLLNGHIKRKKAHQAKGNGFGFSVYKGDEPYTNTISARYYKDGSEILIDQSDLNKNPRKLTPRECARLQGFPENFIVDAVSQGQIYKQFGNAVCVKVIEEIAAKLIPTLKMAAKIQKQLPLDI